MTSWEIVKKAWETTKKIYTDLKQEWFNYGNRK